MIKDNIKTVFESEGFEEIGGELLEAAIDSNVTDPVLQEIPVIKTLVAIAKVHNSISDNLFLRKASRVLLELKETSAEERQKFIEALDKRGNDGAELLMMLIDRLESPEKCEVFGRLCKLKAQERINASEFQILAKVIQDSSLGDLDLITSWLDHLKIPHDAGDIAPVIALGLVYLEPTERSPIVQHQDHRTGQETIEGGEITFNYRLTYKGQLLLDNFRYLFPKWEAHWENRGH